MLTVTTPVNAEDGYGKDVALTREKRQKTKADSIMGTVIKNAETYRHILSRCETNIYIKGRTEILKQNFLIRFAHHLFPVDRKSRDMIFELISDTKYNAPNHFIHSLRAVNGNSIPGKGKRQEALGFLSMNIYSPTIYNEGIITPITPEASKFYTFTLMESETDSSGLTIHRVRFLPKQWSRKLMCGDVYIRDGSWTIDKIDMNGRLEFAEFNLAMTFSRDARHLVLPDKADLYLRYKVLGNTVVSSYHSSFDYKSVEWEKKADSIPRKEQLDLTAYYKLSADTIPIITDTAFWNHERDIPLSVEENALYKRIYLQKADTSYNKYLNLTERLVGSVSLNHKTTRFKYSGLLNPFQLGYSGYNGITYRQKLRISKTFAKDRQIRFRPDVGFVFKRKEVFLSLTGDWEFLPERKGVLSLSLGNKTQSYSSTFMKEIEELRKDTAFNIADLNLKYFRHYFAELRGNIELFNGFQAWGGMTYHRRTPMNKQGNISTRSEDVDNIINEGYHDFTPVIGFSYTPHQYYRMDGYRKEYLYSYYPTLSVEFARAIPGIGKCTGDYLRIEADIHQSIALGLSRKLNYHLSGGMYLDSKSTYFADFHYFARRQFPESWSDDFGGVFNRLNEAWFNASDRYVQMHVMYESPFILSRLFKKNTSRYILSERCYLSQLWTPVLPSYTEVGYGLGNHIFNIAVFAGFDRWRYQDMGIKFAFELFQ